MRLFTEWLRVGGPCDQVTSWLLSPVPVQGLVGQTEWSEHFPDCGGSFQSPVDVATTQTRFDPGLTPLTPLGYDQHGHQPFTLHNNGHTGEFGSGSSGEGVPAAPQPICWHRSTIRRWCSHVLSSCFCLHQLWSSSQTGWACQGCRGSSQQCRCTSIGGVGARARGAVNTPSTAWVQMQRCV